MNDTVRQPKIDRREARLFAGIGVAVATFDVMLCKAFGLRFTWGDHDLALWLGVYLALSFGALGYFLGLSRAAKRQLAEEWARTTKVRNRLVESERMAALGQVAGAVAHEVRNPLAIIRSQVQNLVESDDREADVERTGRLVIEEIDQLSKSTRAIMHLARPLPLRRVETTLHELANRSQILARPYCEERGMRLDVRVVRGDETVTVDPDLVSQLVFGLVGNACQASPTGETVSVEIGRDSRGLVIEVRDRGHGVDPADKAKIFEPFFTTRSAGTGIGLSVIGEIARVHGGQVELVDDGGAIGAVFRAVLPSGTGEEESVA